MARKMQQIKKASKIQEQISVDGVNQEQQVSLNRHSLHCWKFSQEKASEMWGAHLVQLYQDRKYLIIIYKCIKQRKFAILFASRKYS